jgi:hypothetical protein
MSEISEMIMEGLLCQECGVALEDSLGDFPQYCEGCKPQKKKPRPDMNACPHHNCKKLKPRDRYACSRHWFALPQPLKNKIYNGHRASASLWVEADKEAREYWKARDAQ